MDCGAPVVFRHSRTSWPSMRCASGSRRASDRVVGVARRALGKRGKPGCRAAEAAAAPSARWAGPGSGAPARPAARGTSTASPSIARRRFMRGRRILPVRQKDSATPTVAWKNVGLKRAGSRRAVISATRSSCERQERARALRLAPVQGLALEVEVAAVGLEAARGGRRATGGRRRRSRPSGRRLPAPAAPPRAGRSPRPRIAGAAVAEPGLDRLADREPEAGR